MIKLSYYNENDVPASVEFTVNEDATLEELLTTIGHFIKSAGFPIKAYHDLTFVDNAPQAVDMMDDLFDEPPEYTFNLGDVEDPHLYAQMHIDGWAKANKSNTPYTYTLEPDKYSYGYKVTVLSQDC